MIKECLMELGRYAGPMTLLAVELLAGVGLAGWFYRLKKEKNRIKNQMDGRELYRSNIAGSHQEVHLLMRRRDRMPVFMTDNLQSMLGVDPERLRVDLAVLDGCFGRSCADGFWKKYGERREDQVLVQEFQLPGSDRVIELTVTTCPDEAYELFCFRDVTAVTEKIRTLEEQLSSAEDESKSKTTFLSRMSHEIRTPMNGIIGMLTLMHAQPHNDDTEQYLQKTESLSQYLLSLINDILDMSRIEAGKLELEEKAFDLFEIADKLRNMFQKNVESKGVAFVVELLDFDVRYLVGDELRISQVLVNFLSNAVKFTSQGEIRVTFRQMHKENNRLNLMVRVHDTGTGMDPKFISHIFRPFEQENAGIARKYGGSGLGMAITDQIVRLMGGEIVIDSMVGQGSDFTVFLTLPIAKDQSVRESEAAVSEDTDGSDFSMEGLHILMAEDNAINSMIAVRILGMQKATVDVAENGKIAVEKFAMSAPGTYDVILMDIRMPVMDGRTATVEIRKMNRPDAKTIPIFALSADAFVEDQRMSAEIGMNGHFAKPIDFDALRISIGKFMKGSAAKHE